MSAGNFWRHNRVPHLDSRRLPNRDELKTMERQYKRGSEFPHEGFVQAAIERYFKDAGYILDTSTNVDLLCSHPKGGDTWHIEAKGKTAAIGLDFRTCLGQLLQRMSQQHFRHGIALPDIPQYRAQTAQVSPWVVERLGLHWLYVSEGGTVDIVRPLKEEPLRAV